MTTPLSGAHGDEPDDGRATRPDAQTPARARRWVLPVIAVAATLVVVAAIAVVGIVAGDAGPTATPTATPSVTPNATASPDALSFERPADWDPARPGFHLTPEAHWINDPQRPFFAGGLWHLYYLYNADYPDGNGTEWYHATSSDLVTWHNEGVAIEKYRNGLGDILTGSAVVDTTGSAGFGAGAVVALVTQQDDGVQRQSLFYSTDDGYTFAEYDGNPVMDNPGVVDWRDPKVIRDEAHDRWVMVLAEGARLGFYTSPDLRSWTYVSDFVRDDLGLLECPDLFEMIDPESGRRTWILAASADGAASGRTTGFAYWTGTWDGERFTADDADPLWLDDGADFYAAVTWDNPSRTGDDRLTERSALAWMNNWAYARDLPADQWQGGALSTTRTIVLDEVDGRLRLRSRPADGVRGLEGAVQSAPAHVIEPGAIAPLAVQPATSSYRMRVSLDRPASGEVRLRLADTGDSSVTVGFDSDAGVAFVTRADDDAADRMPDTYRTVRTSAQTAGDIVRFDILVDAGSVEVFLGDGSSLTMVIHPGDSSRVTVESTSAPVQVQSLSIAPMAIIDPND
ncbi:glycoside hydrolase family 32 protein [Microbacterium sp.]|uniref:glycoside hydrolase family 32 protein n=1 Tax=Microbacterium sp. TaxID=51671 RepID=UPI0028971181|nr:glycoside hydrolase family 32 protein [Microbacterium sp.]